MKVKVYCWIGIILLQIGACWIHQGLGLVVLGLWCLLISYAEFEEKEAEDGERFVILLSSHEEVTRLGVGEIERIYSMAANADAEDLIKVECVGGKVYWCDSLVVTCDKDYKK